MSTKQYLIDTLAACDKSEFDKVVKTYIKEIFGFKRVVLTDGPYDTGIDIKIFDIEGQKNQYQLTIQRRDTQAEVRSFEGKVLEDLAKAHTNHTQHGYTNNLYFFYSRVLTNKVIREFETKALADFQINLKFVEAKQIAEESEEYLEILNAIVATNDIKAVLDSSKVFPSAEKNLLFDLLSFGKVSDLKLQIIEAFILRQIHLNGEMSLEEIMQSCEEKLRSAENQVFYQKLIGRLLTEKKIGKIEGRLSYSLIPDEHRKISALVRKFELEEATLLSDLVEILKKYNQEGNAEEYTIQLKNIFISNFNADLTDVVASSSSDLSYLSRDFLNFIKSKEVPDPDISKLAIELIEICKTNLFIQKFCAGKVFSEKTNISNIETYIHSRKRIFLDTQIALHAVCYYYNPKSNYKNYYYTTTKSLIEFTRKNKLTLHLPERYLWEAQNHLREALNLIPFTELENFETLGRSRNVFYNFYLNERSSKDESYRYVDFFHDLGIYGRDSYKQHNQLLTSFLENLGITIVPIPTKYDIDSSKNLISQILYQERRFKSQFGLNNDAIMLEYLADGVDVHPLQPLLLSWDKILFKSQKEYFKRNLAAPRWFLLTPSRFIDQYSLLKFSIDGEMVTNDILAVLSDDMIQTTHTLLDSIAHIINPNDEVGREYINIISSIRDNEIHRLKETHLELPDDVEGEAVIDDVWYKLNFHYTNEKFEDFKQIFVTKELIKDVRNTLQKAISTFYENKKFDPRIFEEFDSFIARIKIHS